MDISVKGGIFIFTNNEPEFLHVQPLGLLNLEIKQCGSQKCTPNNRYGPSVRDIYLLHYIISGKGTFQDLQGVFEIEAGDMFLIFPGIPTLYCADNDEPWEYIWVGFSGNAADSLIHLAGLSVLSPVLHNPLCKEYFLGMIDESHNSGFDPSANSLRILGELLRLFAMLSDSNTQQKYMITDRVADFMQNNMSERISVSQLAADFGFSRAYFSSLFKKEKGLSPKQYLINLRLEKARVMLLETDLEISYIARSVGYEDALLFSKQFRAKHGISPRKLRYKYQKNPDE